MNEETVIFIKKLLNNEVGIRKNRMMDCINNGFDAYLDERIKDYREAFRARDEFCEWADDQNFEEGASE